MRLILFGRKHLRKTMGTGLRQIVLLVSKKFFDQRLQDGLQDISTVYSLTNSTATGLPITLLITQQELTKTGDKPVVNEKRRKRGSLFGGTQTFPVAKQLHSPSILIIIESHSKHAVVTKSESIAGIFI